MSRSGHYRPARSPAGQWWRRRWRIGSAFVLVSLLALVAGLLVTGVPSNLDSQTTRGVEVVDFGAPTGGAAANPLGQGLDRATDGDDFGQLREVDEVVHLVVCDAERDGNPVRMDADVIAPGPTRLSIEEKRGAGHCSGAAAAGNVVRVRVCERNTLWWSCDNWTSST